MRQRQPQRRGSKPVIPDRYRPTKADRLASVKGIILARLDRGLPCEPEMFASYGLKRSEALTLVEELRRGRGRGL